MVEHVGERGVGEYREEGARSPEEVSPNRVEQCPDTDSEREQNAPGGHDLIDLAHRDRGQPAEQVYM